MKNKREEMVLNGRTKNYATYERCRRKKKYLKGRIPSLKKNNEWNKVRKKKIRRKLREKLHEIKMNAKHQRRKKIR